MDTLESSEPYKILFNQVLEELNATKIKFKIAISEEEKTMTGLNVLLNSENIQENNKYMHTLPIKKKDEID